MVGTLILVVAAAIGWVWLGFGLFRPGWRGRVAALAVQISLVVFIYGSLRGGPLAGLTSAAFPPLILFFLPDFDRFGAFLSPLFWIAAPVTLGVFALCLVRPRLRAFCVAPPLLAGLVTMVVVGERVSRQAMCREAAALGITTFERHTLLWSLANIPRDFQTRIHAVASLDGKTLGWSYREMTWYDIPEKAAGNVEKAPDFTCP